MSIIWVSESRIFLDSSNFLEFLKARFIILTLGILRIDVNLEFCQRNSEYFVFSRKSKFLKNIDFFVYSDLILHTIYKGKICKNVQKSQNLRFSLKRKIFTIPLTEFEIYIYSKNPNVRIMKQPLKNPKKFEE